MKQNFPRDQKFWLLFPVRDIRKSHKNGRYIKIKKVENLKHCGVMASDKLTEIFLEF